MKDATAKPQQRINTINHNQFPVVVSKENNLLGIALNQNGGYLYKKSMDNPGINTPVNKIFFLSVMKNIAFDMFKHR